MTVEPEIVVVGAGLAGLSAALVLAEAGLSVEVVEARPRVGGRARSVAVGTGAIDLGATWFWSNEPLVRSLCERFGVPTFEQDRAGEAIVELPGEEVRRLGGNPLDAPAARFGRGAQSLAEAMARELGCGRIHLGERITEVTVLDEGDPGAAAAGADASSRRVELRSEHRTLQSDHVVIAVPPAVAVDTMSFTPGLPGPVRSTAETMDVWMSGMVKAIAVYEHDFWHPHGLAAAAMSHVGPFREFHDHSGPRAGDVGEPAAIFGFAPAQAFVGAGGLRADEAEIAEAFRLQLVRLFGPAASDSVSMHVADWSADPLTCPSRSRMRTTADFGAPILHRPSHGRIHWASTETADAFAGHLEGAIRAGIRAARAITAEAAPTARASAGE
ncbi:monoamine oxidase [Brevibacterium sanguinis]|uniref:Monoamine oxidase n=2 Tax=Brevibacterium TaxID=1696 RepID=A0A366IDU4_9MICO|nr:MULTISPECIES: NAD(P)/FAD-dependent oxidoreductase [Brevibacterium]RBP62559.1 monoamine oxidase [Brevibacterium sanguinis]RBP69223.1 monoamine oxidase [Brevibacterium celere]